MPTERRRTSEKTMECQNHYIASGKSLGKEKLRKDEANKKLARTAKLVTRIRTVFYGPIFLLLISPPSTPAKRQK